MSVQRRTSTSSSGGATPGRDDEYPTDTFDSVVDAEDGFEDAGWDDLVGSAAPPASSSAARDASGAAARAPEDAPRAPSRAPEDDERPTQVFSAIRDDAPGQPPAAEQRVGGPGVPEEDDTAVFARYRDDGPDPRASQSTPVVRPGPRDDAHTEQFAAYQDEAHAATRQTGGAGSRSRSGPSVPAASVPVPMTPPMPAGLGRTGATPDTTAPEGADRDPETPRPPDVAGASGGRRALREPAEHVVPGPGAPAQTADQPGGAGEQPETQSEADGQEQKVRDGQTGEQPAETVLDKKAAKKLAKEQAQAAKEAEKTAKAAAAQAAKDEKAAAKAAKKTGRGRGGAEAAAAAAAVAATGTAVAASADGSATAAPGAVASAASSEVGLDQPETSQTSATPGAAVVDAPATPRRKAPVMVVLLLLFIAVASGAAAWLFQQQAATASRQRPSSNIALLDKSATADAVAQVSKAVEAIYTYDSSSLDQSESSALSQITGSYVSEFKDNFDAVRALPPQQRASLTSKVAAAGVITLTERRASLLVMLDQVGRRGDNATPVQSAVRLSVTAQRVDGQWKVSDISQK